MWVHLFPSRTQKLSTSAPTILGGRLPGKIGNANMNLTASAVRFFLYTKRSREWCLTRFFLFLCFLRSCIFEVCFFSCSFNGCILYYFLRRGFSCGSSPRGSSSMIFLTVFQILAACCQSFQRSPAGHQSNHTGRTQTAAPTFTVFFTIDVISLFISNYSLKEHVDQPVPRLDKAASA